MTEVAYLVNAASGKRYQIIKYDKETNRIFLKGEFAEFDEDFNKERFKKMGYALVKEQVEEDA